MESGTQSEYQSIHKSIINSWTTCWVQNTQHRHGNKHTVTSLQNTSLLLGASLYATTKWLHAPQAVCVSTTLSSFLGPDGHRPHPVSLPKQWWWLTGIYDREVKASLVLCVLEQTSMTGRHFNHKLLIHTGRQHGKHDSVSDVLTGGDVMILTITD